MSQSNSLDFASLFPGVPPVPPPPPPIPDPAGRRRRRKGKEKLEAHGTETIKPEAAATTAAPKPTTTTLTFNPSPSPKPTTTVSAAKRNSTTLPAKAPLVQDQAAEARKDEQFDQTDLKARVRKLLVVDDQAEDPRPQTAKPTLNVFAVVKKPASKASKPANKQRPKAAIQDPSYRPQKSENLWSSSEYDSDEDADWDFVPGDLPQFSQTSPITTIPSRPPRPPPPPPPPPPPIPNKLKRKRMDDLTYRPSRNSEESSFDDEDEDDEESDKDLDMDFVPGDLPAFNQTLPVTSVLPRLPQPPPRPPPPIPNKLKRKRMDNLTYRPSRDSEESSFDDDDDDDEEEDDESDKDLDMDFVPGDLPAFSQTSPVTNVPPRPPPPPPRPPPPRPPPPIPNKLKRKRIDDLTYRPSRNSEESSFDDEDEEDDESDEGIKALKGLEVDDVKVKTTKGVVAKKQLEKLPDEEKGIPPTKRNGDEKRNPIKKKGKSIWDPSYKPPRDEEDDSDEYTDEYTSTDGGSRQRRRKRIRVPERGDETKDKDDNNGNVNDNLKNHVMIPQEKLLPCQARPQCLPPKFGRRKLQIKQKNQNRPKPPRRRIYDPSYKPEPGTTSTSTDDDSDSNNSAANDSSWSSEGKDKTKRKKAQRKAPKTKTQTQTVSDLQQEVIRLMLEETYAKKSAMTLTTKKRKQRPRILLRRHTSDQSFRPSDSSDEYSDSDEWFSSELSSELDVNKNKKRKKKGTKKKKDQPTTNVNRISFPGLGPVTRRVLDLDCGSSPVNEASEEKTKESVKPEKQQPASRKKTGRRRIGTLVLDGTYKPSADSPSSESEFEAIPDLDHSVSSMKISNDNEKPELIVEPERELSVPPVNPKGDTLQAHTGFKPLSNIKTAFYPLCHGRYSPWPPARGTVYCQPCFREQVIVRGLLIRRGISETMRLLKVLLGGGGSDFGKELDEALEKVLGGVVETEQMRRSTRVEDYGQGQDEEDEREERVIQRGQDTHTKLVPSAQSSSLPELPEDVQTLLVLRRLSDIVVNTRSTPTTLSTARSSGSECASPTTPSSLYFPSNADTVSPEDPCYQQQDPTGPSRYSSPFPPCPALIPQGEAQNRTGNGAGINMSYFSLKPPSTRSIISLPSQNPLDNAINILHDALGISTWQARRLWNQYEGSGIWDLAKVDSLVKKSHAKFLNGHQVIKKFPGAEGRNSDLEVGMGNDEKDQAVMLELEGLAELEEEITIAFASDGSREGERTRIKNQQEPEMVRFNFAEKEGRTQESNPGGTRIRTGNARGIVFGAATANQTGRKRSRDDDDCRLGRDHAQTPSKKCKLIKPIDLLNPKSQEALPVSPQRPREKPRMIPCHSCSGFTTVNYNSCAAVRRNDYTEMGGRPWVKTLQWTLDINESEAAKMTLNSFLDLISRSGKAAHVKSSGWEFVVHRPGGDNDAETKIIFLNARPGLDLHL